MPEEEGGGGQGKGRGQLAPSNAIPQESNLMGDISDQQRTLNHALRRRLRRSGLRSVDNLVKRPARTEKGALPLF